MKIRDMFTQGTMLMAISLMVFTFTVGESHAADGKVYAASDCKPLYTNRGIAQYASDGSVSNLDRYWLYVTCPLMRDNTTNTNGLKKVKIGYQDSHPSLSVYCTIYSRGFLYLSHKSRTSPIWQGTQTPTKGLLTINGPRISNAEDSLYYAICKIPPKSNVGESKLFAFDVLEY